MRGWILVAGLAVMSGCGEERSTFVVVEAKDPAFTVFTPSPPNMSETLLRRIVSESAEPGKARVIPWADLQSAAQEEAGRVIERADYPGTRYGASIACLMRKSPGPWGISWNGGIAFTRNDYDYARKTYERRDPPDPRSPITPASHLGPLGCP